MYVTKKINIMATKTLTPGVKWCNEAIENADVIIYDNSYYKKYYSNDNESYFSFYNVTQESVVYHRIKITKNSDTISHINKIVN